MALIEAFENDDGRRGYRLRSPKNLEDIGEFIASTTEEVNAAVARAREAQPRWEALGYKRRAQYLDALRGVMLERQDEIIATVIRETGKAEAEALGEVISSLDGLQYYAKYAEKILGQHVRRAHLFWPFKKLLRHYQPLGVVGVITPWNFPFTMGANPGAQALISGNTIVLKPSEVCPFSGKILAELIEQAGFPDNVFQTVLGDGEAGAALCDSKVDKIHFTGSVRTGRKVGESCGRRLLPCTLELGGKDPAIVCADADLERAIPGVVNGAFFNTGQACASTERVYVVEQIADQFIAGVKAEVDRMRQTSEGESDVGPMIWDNQLEIVEKQVNDAVDQGATVLCGGQRLSNEKSGLYYAPTVLTDVTHDMDIMTEETFGPVLPIMRVRDEQEALQLANDTKFGLSASVWTPNLTKGIEIAKRIHSGGCGVNEFGALVYGTTEGSFGGRHESGVGRINGEAGLKSFCNVQHIIVHRLGPKREQSWFPYTMDALGGMKKFVGIMWGTSLGRWIS